MFGKSHDLGGFFMDDKFLTVKQVAKLLGISRASVYGWAKSGTFPPQRKFSRSSRWSEREILQWAESRPMGAHGGKKQHA